MPQLLQRVAAAAGAGPGEERRGEEQPVQDHGAEQALDVAGHDEVAALQERPRTGGALLWTHGREILTRKSRTARLYARKFLEASGCQLVKWGSLWRGAVVRRRSGARTGALPV